MSKERRVNLIRALKYELIFYKNQKFNCEVVSPPFEHVKLQTRMSKMDVVNANTEGLRHYINNRFSEQFISLLNTMIPVYTYYDQETDTYAIQTDIYVKWPKGVAAGVCLDKPIVDDFIPFKKRKTMVEVEDEAMS